jgi:UDP-N-acetylmuramoylalanine--D-glutamate ligase
MARLTVERVRHLVLFGEAAGLIAEAVVIAESAGRREDKGASAHRVWIHQTKTLDRAVEMAAAIARRGDIVLLSPGGTSFDAYRDFEERGEHFGRLVRALDES